MVEAVVRIPGARPIQRKKLPREMLWNNRFWVQEMPKYDLLNDVHAVGYKEKLGRNKKAVLLAPGRIRRARSPTGSPNKNLRQNRSRSGAN
jgi:hypothetical protein